MYVLAFPKSMLIQRFRTTIVDPEDRLSRDTLSNTERVLDLHIGRGYAEELSRITSMLSR